MTETISDGHTPGPGDTIPDDRTIYVGNKPIMNYVLAIVTQFTNGAPMVAVKARGKAISRAVDSVEIALGRFLPQIEKRSIQTSTDIVDTERGKTNVSTIEIILTLRK